MMLKLIICQCLICLISCNSAEGAYFNYGNLHYIQKILEQGKTPKKLVVPPEAYMECVEQFQHGDCEGMTEAECRRAEFIRGAMCVVERLEEK